MNNNSSFKIFWGTGSQELAKKVCKDLKEEHVGKFEVNIFEDGEIQPRYMESLRGEYVFIIQSTNPPAENLMELLVLVDAAKRASAREVVVVIPYFGYSRQDRKDRPRVSLGAKLVANMLESAGITRMVTIDLHADQIQGFFSVPVDGLYASAVFVPYIRKMNLENVLFAAPDIGSSKRVNAYAQHLGCEFVVCHKQRKKANEVETINVIGDVTGKDVVIIDDIIDTGGTLVKASEEILNKGAKTVRAICTHPLLSGNAIEKIENSPLKELLVTDTIPLTKTTEKIKVLSVSDLLSKVATTLVEDKSISSLFVF